MKKDALKTILTIVGAVLFNIIFWQEKIAVNAIIFDAFILWSVFYLYPLSISNTTAKWLLAGHLITLAAVVIHNTELSKLAFSITLMLLVMFVQYLHRSVWYAAVSVLMNYIMMAPSFSGSLFRIRVKGIKAYSFYKSFRFIIIPLVLAAVFFIIYSFANAVFRDMMNDAATALQNFFSRFFDWFNWERFGFLILGFIVTGGLLLKRNQNIIAEKDLMQKEEMQRKKKNFGKWRESLQYDILSLFIGRFANGNLALKNENTIGLISLGFLNVLLLCTNCIDIVYVWFGYGNKRYDMNLSDYVHEGTWLLIFSIVLAMSILLFFFRGNLNFYKKNKWLKYGAYGWIFQNMILVISVLIRDYYYIAHCGLAYKRIGVLFFLLMVLAGLITVFLKIRNLKTTYYLLKVNAFFGIALLVLSSCVHWDELIAEYNLERKDTITLDVGFLLSLSEKALPVIEKNKDALGNAPIYYIRENDNEQALTPLQFFNRRKNQFIEEQKTYSWLSWNEADDYVRKHIQLTK